MKITIISFLILLSVSVYSQVEPSFNKVYLPFGNIQTDANKIHKYGSNYIVQGHIQISDTFFLVKLDSLGNIIQKKTYSENGVGSASKYAQVVWKKNKFIFFTHHNDSSVSSLFISVFDYNLDTLWTKKFNNNIFFSNISANYPRKVVETPDGGFLISGILRTPQSVNQGTPYLLKTDSLLNKQWVKVYNQLYGSEIYEIALTNDMGILAYSNSQNGKFFKMNALGEILDTININVSYAINDNNSLLKIGDDYILGFLKLSDSTDAYSRLSLYVLKLDYLNWNISWRKVFNLGIIQFYPDIKMHYLSENNFSISLSSVFGINMPNVDWRECGLVFDMNLNGDSLNLQEYRYYEADGNFTSYLSMNDCEKTSFGYIGCGETVIHNNNIPMWVFKADSNGYLSNENSEIISQSIKVFPNPTNNMLNFELINGSSMPEKIMIYSSIGVLSKELRIEENNFTISVSSLNPGLYFYKVIYDNDSVDEGKFVIIK